MKETDVRLKNPLQAKWAGAVDETLHVRSTPNV